MLLSTYDPATVERFRVRAAAEGWVLQLVDVPRLDDDPDMTTLVYAETVGPVTEMLNSLVNLHLAGADLLVFFASLAWRAFMGDRGRPSHRVADTKPRF